MVLNDQSLVIGLVARDHGGVVERLVFKLLFFQEFLLRLNYSLSIKLNFNLGRRPLTQSNLRSF